VIVFLSPHLDDAIYSCGAHIAQLTHPVTILTVMAGDPPDPLPDTPLVHELHTRWEAGDNPVAFRRREDRNAANALASSAQIHTHYLPIPDCVYRMHNGVGLYPIGDDDLFGLVHPDDPAKAALATTDLPDADKKTLYAPLGVGNHVDHQLVRDWAFQLKQKYPQLDLYLYADYPYSANIGAINHTLNQLAVPCSHVQVPLSEAAIQRWIAAAAQYTSQMSTFWSDEKTMQKHMRNYLNTMSTPPDLMQSYWQPLTQEMN